MKNLLVILALIAPLCASASIPSRSLLETHHSQFWGGEGLIIVSEQKAFEQIWNLVNGANPPAVDFEKEIVFVYQDGQKPSGMFSTNFAAIDEENGKIVVNVNQNEPGASCFVTADIGNPAHIIAVPRKVRETSSWWKNKPVEVRLKRVIHPCN